MSAPLGAESDDDGVAVGWFGSGGAPELDALVAASLDRAEVHDHHTILIQIQERPDLHLEFLEFHVGEFATEDGVLERVTGAFHRLIDLAVALRLADVVGDEVDVAHGEDR